MGEALNLLRRRRSMARALWFMVSTGATLWTFVIYIRSRWRRKKLGRFDADIAEFRQHLAPREFTVDWFTRNIAEWLDTFERCGFTRAGSLRALEIGANEGMSSLFLATRFEKLALTCVDPWEDRNEVDADQYGNHAESRFDRNMAKYAHVVTKYRGRSLGWFSEHSSRECYDFIYIDGSHYVDDVIIDAIKGFEALKIGGLMIFDDYFWWYYDRPMDNTSGAINAFLRLKRGEYDLIYVGWQVHIRKCRRSRALGVPGRSAKRA